jgi:hypothetical protein
VKSRKWPGDSVFARQILESIIFLREAPAPEKSMFNGKVNNRNVSMSGKPNRRNRREVLGKFFFFFWCQIVVV